MDTRSILCHVSDVKVSILEPEDGRIYFSEDKFISMFGKYLYLFDKDILVNKYGAIKRDTSGVACLLPMNYDKIPFQDVDADYLYFYSKHLGSEWLVTRPVDVADCLGILEHWNHMEGVIGRHGPMDKLWELKVNLMNKETYINGH